MPESTVRISSFFFLEQVCCAVPAQKRRILLNLVEQAGQIKTDQGHPEPETIECFRCFKVFHFIVAMGLGFLSTLRFFCAPSGAGHWYTEGAGALVHRGWLHNCPLLP